MTAYRASPASQHQGRMLQSKRCKSNAKSLISQRSSSLPRNWIPQDAQRRRTTQVLFLDLPREIRLKIYGHVLSNTIIHVRRARRTHQVNTRQLDQPFAWSPCRNPGEHGMICAGSPCCESPRYWPLEHTGGSIEVPTIHPLAIMLASKKTYVETRSVLFEQATLSIHIEDVEEFTRNFVQMGSSSTRKISLHGKLSVADWIPPYSGFSRQDNELVFSMAPLRVLFPLVKCVLIHICSLFHRKATWNMCRQAALCPEVQVVEACACFSKAENREHYRIRTRKDIFEINKVLLYTV
jgi:hypothetical protein